MAEHKWSSSQDDNLIMAREAYGTFENHTARSHYAKTKDIQPADWMSMLEDDLPVSSLTIPGTHDSAAHGPFLPFVVTHFMSIAEQLEVGIRFLDLRCALRSDIVQMVHGRAFLSQTFAEVLQSMYMFLDKHSTEGMIVTINQDQLPKASTLDFADAIAAHIDARPDKWRTEASTPSLAELRGKIQLMCRYTGADRGINLSDWTDNSPDAFTITGPDGLNVVIQDHYTCSTPLPLSNLLERKSADVQKLLQSAADDTDEQRWYLNFNSAFELHLSQQCTPIEVALGAWRGFRRVKGMNARLACHLKQLESRRRHACRNAAKTPTETSSPHEKVLNYQARYGIILMDFPNEGLIADIIACNFPSRRSQRSCASMVLVGFLAIVFVTGIAVRLVYALRSGSALRTD